MLSSLELRILRRSLTRPQESAWLTRLSWLYANILNSEVLNVFHLRPLLDDSFETRRFKYLLNVSQTTTKRSFLNFIALCSGETQSQLARDSTHTCNVNIKVNWVVNFTM